MKDSDSGLVRYRGLKMSPALAKLLKDNIPHKKARKYAPRGVDPATISPSLADEALIRDSLSPEARDQHDRAIASLDSVIAEFLDDLLDKRFGLTEARAKRDHAIAHLEMLKRRIDAQEES